MSLNRDPSPANPDLNSNPDKQLAGRRTLLLVDDEKALREIIAGILRRAGYLVLEAGTSDDALKAAHRSGQKLDLLISDVVLPGCGGMRLFEDLRKANPQLRAIFISGHTLEEVYPDGPLPKGTAFVEKPFENEAFLNTVREVLN